MKLVPQQDFQYFDLHKIAVNTESHVPFMDEGILFCPSRKWRAVDDSEYKLVTRGDLTGGLLERSLRLPFSSMSRGRVEELF